MSNDGDVYLRVHHHLGAKLLLCLHLFLRRLVFIIDILIDVIVFLRGLGLAGRRLGRLARTRGAVGHMEQVGQEVLHLWMSFFESRPIQAFARFGSSDRILIRKPAL